MNDGLFPLKRTTGPQVFNKHKRNAPAGCIYIGRGSPWGNPFVIGQDGDRAEVIAKYEQYLLNNSQLLARARRELRGKDLLCFCAPAACHGDILLRESNI